MNELIEVFAFRFCEDGGEEPNEDGRCPLRREKGSGHVFRDQLGEYRQAAWDMEELERMEDQGCWVGKEGGQGEGG